MLRSVKRAVFQVCFLGLQKIIRQDVESGSGALTGEQFEHFRTGEACEREQLQFDGWIDLNFSFRCAACTVAVIAVSTASG